MKLLNIPITIVLLASVIPGTVAPPPINDLRVRSEYANIKMGYLPEEDAKEAALKKRDDGNFREGAHKRGELNWDHSHEQDDGYYHFGESRPPDINDHGAQLRHYSEDTVANQKKQAAGVPKAVPKKGGK